MERLTVATGSSGGRGPGRWCTLRAMSDERGPLAPPPAPPPRPISGWDTAASPRKRNYERAFLLGCALPVVLFFVFGFLMTIVAMVQYG